jgi:hypothetical protein
MDLLFYSNPSYFLKESIIPYIGLYMTGEFTSIIINILGIVLIFQNNVYNQIYIMFLMIQCTKRYITYNVLKYNCTDRLLTIPVELLNLIMIILIAYNICNIQLELLCDSKNFIENLPDMYFVVFYLCYLVYNGFIISLMLIDMVTRVAYCIYQRQVRNIYITI